MDTPPKTFKLNKVLLWASLVTLLFLITVILGFNVLNPKKELRAVKKHLNGSTANEKILKEEIQKLKTKNRQLAIASGDQRASAIKRLPPKAFSQLPTQIVNDLEKRGCTIPQIYANQASNVIHGEFKQKGIIDWAILCSSNNISTILIYWAGDPNSVDAIRESPDRKWLQSGSDGIVNDYSRAIGSVGASYINHYYARYGGPKPPLIDHHGINEYFIDKASTVNYYHEGKWLRLSGAD